MQMVRIVLVLAAAAAMAGQYLQERYRLTALQKLPGPRGARPLRGPAPAQRAGHVRGDRAGGAGGAAGAGATCWSASGCPADSPRLPRRADHRPAHRPDPGVWAPICPTACASSRRRPSCTSCRWPRRTPTTRCCEARPPGAPAARGDAGLAGADPAGRPPPLLSAPAPPPPVAGAARRPHPHPGRPGPGRRGPGPPRRAAPVRIPAPSSRPASR